MFLEYKVIGRHIRDARKQKNMTQEQVAKAIDISLQHYGKVERGDRHINLTRLAELSILLDVPIEKLVEGAVIHILLYRMTFIYTRIWQNAATPAKDLQREGY